VPAGSIAIVQIAHPGPTDDAFDDYWTEGTGARLSAMYAALLDMEPIYIGYHKLVHADGSTPEIGFEYAPDDPAPAWPDEDRPQQVHLDIEVGDIASASALVERLGATRLCDGDADDHVVFADPVGHPFCLYERDGLTTGRMARIVFDCFSPRSLAAFYQQLLDLPDRTVDTESRVEIVGPDCPVALAFQHSRCLAPRWPDPRHPAQLHVDITSRDESFIADALRLGAIDCSLPERPDNTVLADPAGHPFCVGIGEATHGPAQVAEYEAWLASRERT